VTAMDDYDWQRLDQAGFTRSEYIEALRRVPDCAARHAEIQQMRLALAELENVEIDATLAQSIERLVTSVLVPRRVQLELEAALERATVKPAESHHRDRPLPRCPRCGT